MSASVDQRNKGQSNQVSNGPSIKEQVKPGEFEAYLQGAPHQAYSTAPMSSPTVSDAYMPSYYPSMPFPYMNQGGLGDGAWSNGSDPMSFLGGYGQVGTDNMYGNGMFNSFTYNQPGFGWEFPGGEYNAWGTTAAQGRKEDQRSYDQYYGPGTEHMTHADMYGAMNGDLDRDGMKTMDQGFKGMNIGDGQGDGVDMSQHPPEVVQMVSAGGPTGIPSQAPKKMTWASIASQPAKPQPQLKPKSIPRAPVLPSKHNMDIGTWENKNNGPSKQQSPQGRQNYGATRGGRNSGTVQTYNNNNNSNSSSSSSSPNGSTSKDSKDTFHPVLEKLRSANLYNPKSYDLNPKGCRFFIIKSYSEDDIHRSIKYNIWCSTEHGNKRLDSAFKERESKGPVYLFFSVNGSGHFCGMAQMMTLVDYGTKSGVWAQDKWKGQFEVKWIYVKDVPNNQLRHIRLENNENKPVTNSRDTQEVPPEKGKQVLRIMHNYKHTTSIFDDFIHYEKRQEEDTSKPKASRNKRQDRDYDEEEED